jgi:Yip1 domain
MSAAPTRPALLQFGAVLFDPQSAIADIGAHPPSSARSFFGAALWLGLCPPLFAYVGTTLFGWRLGVDPLFLPPRTVLAIAAAYFALLLVGFLSTAVVARWMSGTYGADGSLQRCIALVTLVGTPLTVGSVVHLYPNAFVNVLVLVPTLIFSMYLLYRGLPVVLKTDQGRGMLMASSLIAYMLVSWVTLLGITAVLWSRGVGPQVAT